MSIDNKMDVEYKRCTLLTKAACPISWNTAATSSHVRAMNNNVSHSYQKKSDSKVSIGEWGSACRLLELRKRLFFVANFRKSLKTDRCNEGGSGREYNLVRQI